MPEFCDAEDNFIQQETVNSVAPLNRLGLTVVNELPPFTYRACEPNTAVFVNTGEDTGTPFDPDTASVQAPLK